MKTQIAAIFIFHFFLATQGAKRKILIMEFTKVNIDNKFPELLNFTYMINRTSRNISSVNVEFKVTEDVLKLPGTLNLQLKYTDKYINYITLDLDYCKAMQLLYKDNILKSIINELRTVSNYPLDCPIIKNKQYYINGFKFNTKTLPSYFPELSFALHAKLNTILRPVIDINVFGELKRK